MIVSAISSSGTEPAEFITKGILDEGVHFFAIYCSQSKFANKGMGKSIRPEIISKEAQVIMQKHDKDENILELLNEVIKYDEKNIKNDFPFKSSLDIIEYMIGDMNGDNNQDFVVSLGKISEPGGAGVIIYLIIKITQEPYTRTNVRDKI